MTKPGIPQGTRDFSADVVRKRNHILSVIRAVFELYGFQPLETPAMENLDTLMGKYGEEGDKLIFRILNNGLSDPKNIEKAKAGFENTLQGRYDKNLTERALRYDLTIPFARYVAMNFGQLTMPFRRYQVQPVWRADRPQKGRYREFFQCDADVVGSRSLLNEVELAIIYHQVFSRLGLEGYELRINSRKILTALANQCGGQESMQAITIAIDKLDKVGLEKVKEELVQKHLDNSAIDVIDQYLRIEGTNEERLQKITALLHGTEELRRGCEELKTVLEQCRRLEPSIPLMVDFTLARGLNYYTGIIFEAKAPPQVNIGSIGGGGRYDDLTGLFGVPNVPGVGISFGVDRIFDVMEELNRFPAELSISTGILFLNTSEAIALKGLQLAHGLRLAGLSCEVYHEPAKLEKQFKYAERKNIPVVITLNEEEKSARLKNILTGKQESASLEDVDAIKEAFERIKN
jgi:histidyl-tRNA synthetase